MGTFNPFGDGVFPDQDEEENRHRTIIRKQHFGAGGQGMEPLFLEEEVYQTVGEDTVIDSTVIHRQLPDGTYLYKDEQLAQKGVCEVVLTEKRREIVCLLEGSMIKCGICGRRCCRFHRARISSLDSAPPELMEYLRTVPKHLANKLTKEKVICHNCFQEIERETKRAGRFEFIKRVFERFLRLISANFRA